MWKSMTWFYMSHDLSFFYDSWFLTKTDDFVWVMVSHVSWFLIKIYEFMSHDFSKLKFLWVMLSHGSWFLIKIYDFWRVMIFHLSVVFHICLASHDFSLKFQDFPWVTVVHKKVWLSMGHDFYDSWRLIFYDFHES